MREPTPNRKRTDLKQKENRVWIQLNPKYRSDITLNKVDPEEDLFLSADLFYVQTEQLFIWGISFLNRAMGRNLINLATPLDLA